MLKAFRPWTPHQGLLLPHSLMEWLPAGHLALFIREVVEELDLRAIYASYGGDLRGQPPYEPKMMVAVLLVERSRIADLRRGHGSQLEQLFVQVLRLCQEAGLVKLEHVAVDGTKMKANASKHKAMRSERVQKEEARLREKVKMLPARAESVDSEEDALYGKRRRGDELPEERRRAETRLARIREAKKALDAEHLRYLARPVNFSRSAGVPCAVANFASSRVSGKSLRNVTWASASLDAPTALVKSKSLNSRSSSGNRKNSFVSSGGTSASRESSEPGSPMPTVSKVVNGVSVGADEAIIIAAVATRCATVGFSFSE